MTTEKQEYQDHISRYRAQIAQQLVEKFNVKPEAAAKVVMMEVQFGLSPSNMIVMRYHNSPPINAANSQLRMADSIRQQLPEDAFVEEDVEDDSVWNSFQKRLNDTSGTYSREELREQKQQAEIERIKNPPPPPTGEAAEGLARMRAEISSAI